MIQILTPNCVLYINAFKGITVYLFLKWTFALMKLILDWLSKHKQVKLSTMWILENLQPIWINYIGCKFLSTNWITLIHFDTIFKVEILSDAIFRWKTRWKWCCNALFGLDCQWGSLYWLKEEKKSKQFKAVNPVNIDIWFIIFLLHFLYSFKIYII